MSHRSDGIEADKDFAHLSGVERAITRSVQFEYSGSRAEWQTRCDLVALFRLAERYGMDDVIYTHISARVPGEEDAFLLNPFGLLFREITPESLVKVDKDGRAVPGSSDRIAPFVHTAGFVIHSAVHLARPDLMFVIHAHTAFGMAVSAFDDGLLPLTQHAMMYYGEVGYHDYESFANQEDERARIAKDLGSKNILILRNHGTLVGGASAPLAFYTAYHLERAFQAQCLAIAAGRPLHMPDLRFAARTATRTSAISPDHVALFWAASLRALE